MYYIRPYVQLIFVSRLSENLICIVLIGNPNNRNLAQKIAQIDGHKGIKTYICHPKLIFQPVR